MIEFDNGDTSILPVCSVSMEGELTKSSEAAFLLEDEPVGEGGLEDERGRLRVGSNCESSIPLPGDRVVFFIFW